MVILSVGAKANAAPPACKLPYTLDGGVYEVTQSWCAAAEGMHLVKAKMSGGRDLFPTGRAVAYTSTFTAGAGWGTPRKHESVIPVMAAPYNDTAGRRIGMVHSEQMMMDTDAEIEDLSLELIRADGQAVDDLEEWGVTISCPNSRI